MAAGIDTRRVGRALAATIQRMEAGDGVVDTLMKVIQALDEARVELIGENQASGRGGNGVRLKATVAQDPQG